MPPPCRRMLGPRDCFRCGMRQKEAYAPFMRARLILQRSAKEAVLSLDGRCCCAMPDVFLHAPPTTFEVGLPPDCFRRGHRRRGRKSRFAASEDNVSEADRTQLSDAPLSRRAALATTLLRRIVG